MLSGSLCRLPESFLYCCSALFCRITGYFFNSVSYKILLIFSDLPNYCVDICECVLTVGFGLRIVRFLRCCSEGETEEMIIPQSGFVTSVLGKLFNKQITDKCECDKPHTV